MDAFRAHDIGTEPPSTSATRNRQMMIATRTFCDPRGVSASAIFDRSFHSLSIEDVIVSTKERPLQAPGKAVPRIASSSGGIEQLKDRRICRLRQNAIALEQKHGVMCNLRNLHILHRNRSASTISRITLQTRKRKVDRERHRWENRDNGWVGTPFAHTMRQQSCTHALDCQLTDENSAGTAARSRSSGHEWAQ
jgi:hypothetical protein